MVLIFMNKNKIIIICGLVLVIIVLFFVFHKNYDNKVERYLKAIGFEKTGNLYEKRLLGARLDKYYYLVDQKLPAESVYLYFDLDRSLLTEVNLKNSFDLNYTFDGSYDYKSDTLSYSYEVSNNDIAAMVKGKYLKKSDSYSCEIVYMNNDDTGDNNMFSLICEQAQFVCKDFSYHVKTLIADPFILDRIKKG